MKTQRAILHRSTGQRHSPITRLINPGDVGEMTKPFVFLDYIDAQDGEGPRFGFHPHSGIATLSFPLNYDLEHETSSGQLDVVQAGGIEWVVTGNGIWHRSKVLQSGATLQGFQLWLALPPEQELAAPHALFFQPDQVPQLGPVRILLGQFDGISSPIPTQLDASCLWVALKAGESWVYTPPASHPVAWSFIQSGLLDISGSTCTKELLVFEPGAAPLEFRARKDSTFLLGSAAKHSSGLVLGRYSVHSSAAALHTGEARITEIGQKLQQAGLR